MASDFVIVLTTFPMDQDVERFATTLVSERLAACVNVLPPMRSIYTWKGSIETADERQLVIKTTAGRVRDLEARITALHPYEVPELLVVPITAGGTPYLNWLAESVR
jgi:periplasmic divalent cation tolerance protein